MAVPFLKFGADRIEHRRVLSAGERALEEHQHLSFYTNIGLAVAVVLGFIVIFLHLFFDSGMSGVTAAITAYGAALGCGGLLGFLFGVPSSLKPPVTVNNSGSIAMGTGNDSRSTSETEGKAADAAVSAPAAPPAVSLESTTATGEEPVPDDSRSTPIPDPKSFSLDAARTSNLEQVADWVTKLLLGGGLTQMQRIPPLIWRWAQIVSFGILGDAKASPQRLLAEQSFAAGLLVYGFLLGFFCGYLITKLQLGKAISE